MKSSNVEIESRILEVIQWIVLGWSTGEILKEGKKRWGLSERQIENYLAKSKEKIVKGYREKMDSELEILDAKFDLIYKKAIENEDLKTALQTLDSKRKYFGIVRESESDKNVVFVNNMPE